MKANSSRPVPTGGGGGWRGLARGEIDADRLELAARGRTAGSRRRRAAAPAGRPASASGETWIAAGTLPLAPDMRPSVTSATLMAAVLQHAERRGQLVQLGHAVGARALEADDDDHVAVELAGLERREHLVLVGEDSAPAPRSSSAPASTALVLKIARPRLPSTSRMPPSAQERVARRAEHVEVARFRRRLVPDQLVAVAARGLPA